MGQTPESRIEKHICLGILAHVDAGKTTLSEAMLYLSGSIRKLGRVDNRDAFLDHQALERARGITIFSKQAIFTAGDTRFTLLDTPGHVDFSAETERTLQVLDYAVLVISGADGVQGHTRTLWRLLEKYGIPVFLFINKMDQSGTDRAELLAELRKKLSDNCVDFTEDHSEDFFDQAAMCDEAAMEAFLETGSIDLEMLREMIAERIIFPCYFGSALKLQGVEALMDGFVKYMMPPAYGGDFGAKVFKISRDAQGNRLTHMKVTGGSLKVRASIPQAAGVTEKVNQIRVYSGEKFESVSEAHAGEICAVTGLTGTRPGEGLGAESASGAPLLSPVLTYRMILPHETDPAVLLPKLRQLEEEEPQLHIVWDEQLQEIQAQLMGEVQTEILQSLIAERFGVDVTFDTGRIVYKETIANCVEGVGHFEPLRHYAEVHLILLPGVPGSGLEFGSICSEDVLDRNWQRLILTHLAEKTHVGVLAGYPITDMKIILASGRAHLKHTEGGDFRQATYRALRQGLMEAQSVLLEPYDDFRLEIPAQMVGRAMTDLEKMNASFQTTSQDEEQAVLEGKVPVAAVRDYQKEVTAYTRGAGRIFLSFRDYEPCRNAGEVIAARGYDPSRDTENPSESVFCAHGAGFNVPWNEVKNYMHVESALRAFAQQYGGVDIEPQNLYGGAADEPEAGKAEEAWIDAEEVDAIFSRTFYANRRVNARGKWSKKRLAQTKPAQAEARTYTYKPVAAQEEYLLVDGYNMIHAWDDLRDMIDDNMDGARVSLMDTLCNYQAIRRCRLMVVFDAYQVAGHVTEAFDYKNIRVVYTKEAETADQYIEKFAHENAKKFKIIVATSDGLEQVIIRSQGCALLSARELEEEIKKANDQLQRDYLETQDQQPYRPFDEAAHFPAFVK